MSTIFSHFLVGWGAYRFVQGGDDRGRLGPIVAGAVSMLPDADALLMRWIPYEAPWGHRGITHSLAFAVVVGAVAAVAIRRHVVFPGGLAGLAATLAAVTATHGLIDAMTDGGLGIAFLAPFDEKRWFLMIRPIPVPPITFNPFDPWVGRVIAWEAILLWPWALLLATARRPVPRAVRWASLAGAAVSVVVWVGRCAG